PCGRSFSGQDRDPRRSLRTELIVRKPRLSNADKPSTWICKRCAVDRYFYNIQRRASPPSVALDYRGWPRRRLHSPRAERMKVKPPSPPSAQSVQTKKKPPVDLAISP